MPGAFSKEQKLRSFLKAKIGVQKRVKRAVCELQVAD